MKTNTQTHKEGHILLTCLSLISLVCIGSAMLFKIGSQEIFTKERNVSVLKARLVAETGIRKAFSDLTADSTIRSIPDMSNSCGTVSFTIKQLSGQNALLVTAKGTADTVETEAAAIVGIPAANAPTNSVPPEIVSWFQDTLIFTDGFTMPNDAKILYQQGRTYVGGDFLATGSASNNDKSKENNPGIMEVRGTASILNCAQVKPNIICPNSLVLDASGKHNGDFLQEDVPERTVSLNLAPFKETAEKGNLSKQYESWGTQWKSTITDSYISSSEISDTLIINNSATLEPAGGVLYVEGNITIGSGTTIKADAIVATGNIIVQSDAKNTSKNTFLIASKDGNIDIGGGSKIQVDALLYADKKDISINNNASVNGRVICPNGNFTITAATLSRDKKDDIDDLFTVTIPDSGNTGGTTPVATPPWIAAWVK